MNRFDRNAVARRILGSQCHLGWLLGATCWLAIGAVAESDNAPTPDRHWIVAADDFYAENLAFQNTIDSRSGIDGGQAAELRVGCNWNPELGALASTVPTGYEDLQSMPPGGALDGDKPRVIVSTDIGGSDPDDFQSMVHLLLYADVIDVEGLISSPPGAGRAEHILEVIAAYAQDYSHLKSKSKDYPTPESLRSVVRQGALDKAPQQGWGGPTEGSRWIIERAQADDERPLWIIVWGSITDLAQAIHDDPSIKNNVRVHSIGSWNTSQDRAAREYLFHRHPELWWVESDTTFRGMYMGGVQDGEWGNLSFVETHVKGHGSLGDLYFAKKRDIKMGDTPSLLFLLRGDPDDPVAPHWGGAFVKSEHGQQYWTDNPDPRLIVGGRAGAKTVSDWRREYLEDWKQRMDRVIEP